NLVFYQWSVRSVIDYCPQFWLNSNYVYYADAKDWYHHRASITRHVDPAAQQIQIALGAVDMCASWCGMYGDGSCHSQAPLFDNVRVVRVNVAGPSWDYFLLDLFADNFAADGTLTGTVPIDIAQLRSDGLPRDSATVTVTSAVGIDYHIPGDPSSHRAVYCHIKDVSPAKSGSVVSGDLVRYPFVSTADGWTTLRCYGSSGIKSTIDLNDALYTPGDTVWYYFSARDKNGVTNYWSLHLGVTSSEHEARVHPMEVTCLPANAVNGTTDILYVDGFDGYGAEPFFETAFDLLGIPPDRFDVIDPTYTTGGGPGARVSNVLGQLAPAYRKIVWNTGHLRRGGIYDGLGSSPWTRSSDDFGMLFEFLDQSPNRPGVYLSGDNLATWWTTRSGAGAVNLRDTYLNYTALNEAHTAVGEPVSPQVIALPGSFFDHPSVGPDTLIAFGGGCSGVNDFDVLEATGSAILQMAYSGNPSHGAVVSQTTQNAVSDTARVVLSGFSFHEIRDYRSGSPPARAIHLAAILRWLENDIDDPVGAGPMSPHTNSLGQNYPNPFNPTNTIRYSIDKPAHVSLKIYNVAGQLVKTLVDGFQSPGKVEPLTWDGMNDKGQRVSSGVYFYRMVTKNFARTRKMVLLQ
ncbi:MAG: T9SS type A sorting domain-containing protein, partial [Candidatus Krumholzibacteria bacterium]|nr:T9SS type A sorting domain-containing protein [Candidatus Krumholzibacteria bacterium]